MAKKRENKKGEIREVVANRDQLKEVVTNCDHLEKSKDNLSQHDIEELIITVRGEQVLIDQDIARLYGVTTKALNQQAKRNSARFPSNFRFELTEEERDEVVANCDHLSLICLYECNKNLGEYLEI